MKPHGKPRLPEELKTGQRKVMEKDVEKAVCAYAVGKGWYHRKFVSPAHRAVPDQLLVTPYNLVLFIEFKRPGEKPTSAQVREAARLQECGQLVFCVDNIERGELLIDIFSHAEYCVMVWPKQMPEIV